MKGVTARSHTIAIFLIEEKALTGAHGFEIYQR
jgi:hypothetical protein